ncbi:MAG: acetate/propionate family kinase [Alphaproteobacteria bacterium]|nr:acetate/propionate family kinase [Alphaproteobacteria bacterium]MBU1574982.1 acetate/propionate family kinase [Alphaproteobacteria bacterium]MBU2078687.1 acetate/propionate family kinase [Alphaproteobacteria bacterium]MBU2160268.1 acetate/propionate family kinase [Alphaproteobacteria bacterium]MBU2243297.1 acetate/propionate family kinase [Alphaproteobacteria bacterium]
MGQRILTVNAGSSSVKFALYTSGEDPKMIARGLVQGIGSNPSFKFKHGGPDSTHPIKASNQTDALAVILEKITPLLEGQEVAGVGHRIVHGGPLRATPTELTDDVMADLATFNPLAPLHQPHNLSAVEAAKRAFPYALQIGCFDTAFHRNHPWENDIYAIPRRFYKQGIKRYGFHGLSYDYVSHQIVRERPELRNKRLIIAHLGSGASICAVNNGHSISSTMGFSPLDGLPMSTRSGQLDPGILLYLMETEGMSVKELTHMLYHESGLLGLSGLSADMQVLEASDAPEAKDAIEYFVYRVRREIGAMAATLSGIDALIFCGGIGENSARIRAQIIDRLGYLGIELDGDANDRNARDIGKGPTPVMVIPTDEEQVIANAVARALNPHH